MPQMKRQFRQGATALSAIGILALVVMSGSGPVRAQTAPANGPTFTKDVAPILQRSCEKCHRLDGSRRWR